jgi:hypothetical protein
MARPRVLPGISHWHAFIRFCRNMSSDCLVMLFDEYARDERERQKEQADKAQKLLGKYYPLSRCARQHEVDSTPSPSPPHHTASDTERSIPSNMAGLHPTKPDISTTQSRPDKAATGLPSPASASASSRKRTSSDGDEDDDLTGCKASLASAISETSTSDTSAAHPSASDERASAKVEGADVAGGTGERGCRQGSSLASCSSSLTSSLDEGVRTGEDTDQDTDVDRHQHSQWGNSVLNQNTTSASPSPDACPAKRKGISDSERQSNEESQLHSAKRRRL